MSKVKRLFFDIETSFNIVAAWRTGHKISITHDSILKERAVICICYKWAEAGKVYSITWDKNQDDKEMLEKFVAVANQADELVGHNGDKFDLPWIRTRCLYHRIPMLPQYTTMDTLKGARSKFHFNSAKLDYIAKYLGVGGKTSTGFGLWKDIVLHNSKKALKEMVEYCKNDVVILENVYNEMSPYLPHKTHHGVLAGKEVGSCPNCGGEDMKLGKTRVSAAGVKKYQMQCQSCGKYNTVSETTLSLLKL